MVKTKHDSNVFLSEYGNEVLYLNSITFYPNTINSKEMTSSQLEKAQDLARKCVAKNYKGC